MSYHPAWPLPRPTSVLALIAIAAIGASCSSPQRLTVSEYAELCGAGVASATSLIEPESLTWGDLAELADSSLEQLQPIEPPQELGDFHRASTKAMSFVLDVAQGQPAEALANPLAFGIEAVRIATQFRRAVQDLPADVRAQLRDAGCL